MIKINTVIIIIIGYNIEVLYISHKDTFDNKMNLLYIYIKKDTKIHCNHRVSGSIRYLHMIGYRSDQVSGALTGQCGVIFSDTLITSKP